MSLRYSWRYICCVTAVGIVDEALPRHSAPADPAASREATAIEPPRGWTRWTGAGGAGGGGGGGEKVSHG